MGARNLDRIPMPQWRARCPTVLVMAERRWRIRAMCGGRCKGVAEVDLGRLASARGLDFEPWNRSQPCRTARCGGTVKFWALIPGLYQWRLLEAGAFTPRETEGQRAARRKDEGG